MATGTAQESQNCVTLKGSVELIVDFFSTYCAHTCHIILSFMMAILETIYLYF